MPSPDVEVLPVGHRARPAAALALWVSCASAVAFTVFAYVTTQNHTVRAGSPWQDDPYDGVVSFTEFLVPTLTVLMVARASLCDRHKRQPVFRVNQLLRAAFVCTLLVVGTVATDWVAVALRADHQLWDATTPWLIASLVPLTAAAVVSFVVQRRAFRRLPPQHRRRPDGDWLDDLAALADAVGARLPKTGRRLTVGLSRSGATGFVRSHIVAFAAAASLAAGLLITSAEAIGEDWSSPLLFLTGTAIGAGGFFAFSMVCNTALHIAIPRDTAGTRFETTERVHRAARVSAIAGSLALPISAVLRDPIWAALGRGGHVGTAGQLAVLTLTSALVTCALAFGTTLLLTTATKRRSA